LRGFQKRLSDFDARGVRVVGISSDTPEQSRRNSEKLGFTYTFLCDTNAEVIRRYDLLHKGGGPKGADIARPAEFLVDPAGVVRWVNLTESAAVRARPDQVLAALDGMKITGR
jgi:peroxiredoxin Q/BCP